jgi:hypothetical protein
MENVLILLISVLLIVFTVHIAKSFIEMEIVLADKKISLITVFISSFVFFTCCSLVEVYTLGIIDNFQIIVLLFGLIQSSLFTLYSIKLIRTN